ncbi:NPCBM/NEW2 domain-containing protein [Microbacterium sp. LMI1x-1-1.1]|uniref:NPCBM/NEW2 domain-containing protein n=1 Tax=Microbacterium sp. LMI1x-1-1.1 TaxID=3135246 RepID=UPI0034247E93
MFWGELMRKSAFTRSRVGVAVIAAAVGFGLLAAPSPASAAERTTVVLGKIAAASGGTVTAGKVIVLSGRASANLKGKKLTVQVKAGATWRTLSATPTVTSKQTFAAKVKAVGLGTTTYRIVYPGTTAGKDLSRSTSSRSTVVWQWFPLAGQKTVDSKASYGWYEPYAQAATMAGVYYPEAIAGSSKNDRTSWSEFNLSFQCKQFSALAGTDDSSPSDSSGTSYITVDSTTPSKGSVPLKLGKPTAISLNVTDAMRLRLSVVSPNSDAVTAVWANAKILCKKDVNPKD